MRLRKAVKPPIFALPFTARACHARLARQTRARRQWFGRRTAQVLLADFWYFSSLKSTRKKRHLYEFFEVPRKSSNATPTHMLRMCANSPTIAGRRGADPYNIKSKYSQHTCFACALIPPVSATPSNALRALLNSPKPLRRKDSTVSGGKFYR